MQAKLNVLSVSFLFLIFFYACVEEKKPDKSKPEKLALAELKKFQSYTDIGLSYFEYQKRILDTNAEVKALLPEMKNLQTKTYISDALTAYTDAAIFWGLCLSKEYYENTINKYHKYSVFWFKPSEVPRFWEVAEQHIKDAERLLTDYNK